MDATDQMIKLSLDGTVLILKGSKEVLAFLVAACKGMYDKQTQKIAKEIVLNSSSPMWWTLSAEEVKIFKKECNRYGVNFIAMRDSNKDNLYTVVARSEDAHIINKICEMKNLSVLENVTSEELISGTKTVNEQEQAMELLKEKEIEKSGTSSAFKEEPQEELTTFDNVSNDEKNKLNLNELGNEENLQVARRSQSPSVQQSNLSRNSTVHMDTEEVKIPTVFSSKSPDEIFAKKDSVKEVKRPSIKGDIERIKANNKNKPTEKDLSKVVEKITERS